MNDRYDCIIHGAGMVGLVLANALAADGLRVAVLDQRQPPRWSPDEWDLRVSAVTVASERVLDNLGVWNEIQRRRVSAFAGIRVWDGAGNGALSFGSGELGEPRLGHIVENSLVQTALSDRLSRYPNASFVIPATISGLEMLEDRVRLRLEDGRRLEAELTVAADGADSPLRRLAGIETGTASYGQKGVVAAVETEQPHGGVARQRFLSGGPVAFLPLSDGRCSIVWSVPEARAEQLLELAEDDFCHALTEASGEVLGQVVGTGRRAAFPLRRQHAARYVQPGLALVGDAAHVIHPLAGQGANLGFMDAAALAEVLGASRARGWWLGSMNTLRRYERWRKGENLLMQWAMDGFHLLFGNSVPGVVELRGAGLNLTDRLPTAKKLFMERAMGLTGDLPALARPQVVSA